MQMRDNDSREKPNRFPRNPRPREEKRRDPPPPPPPPHSPPAPPASGGRAVSSGNAGIVIQDDGRGGRLRAKPFAERYLRGGFAID